MAGATLYVPRSLPLPGQRPHRHLGTPLIYEPGQGGAGLQADEICPGLGPVPGPQRRGDPSPLAAGLLRFLILLVASPARSARRCATVGRGRGATGRRDGDGAGGKCARPASRGAGQWRYAPCAPGWSRGSCSGATGGRGRRCLRLLLYALCSSGYARVTGLISMPRPDPRPQSTVSGTLWSSESLGESGVWARVLTL